MGKKEALEKLGTNIKILRLNKDLNISQLSKEIGISYSYLHDIENYKKSPSLEMVDKIAEYFNVEVYELFM